MLRRRRRRWPRCRTTSRPARARGLAAKVDVVAERRRRGRRRHRPRRPAELDATGAQVWTWSPPTCPPSGRCGCCAGWTRPGSAPIRSTRPGGAHEAVVLDPSVATAWRVAPPRAGRSTGRRLVRVTLRAQRHAPTASLVRVAPRLRATPTGPEDALAGAGAAHGLLPALRGAASPAGGGGDRAPGGDDRWAWPWRRWRRPPRWSPGARSRRWCSRAGPRAAAAGRRLRQPRPAAPGLVRQRPDRPRRPAGHPGPRRRAPGHRRRPSPRPRDPVRAPAQHLLLVRLGRPRGAARRHRPAPAQARHLPPRRVPGLRPRVPEPGADRGRPRPLLRRRLRRPGRGAGRDQLRRAGQDLPQPGGGAGPLRRAAGLARRGHRPRPLPAGGPAALARGHLRRAGHERLGHRGRPPGPGRHRLPGHVPRPGRHAAPVLRRGQHAPLPGAHPGPRARAGGRGPGASSRAAT